MSMGCGKKIPDTTMYNASSGSNEYNHVPTMRENELIQKFEEASDEIENLLKVNEKRMKLFNELRFELQKSKGQLSSRMESLQPSETYNRSRKKEYDRSMLDAILNGQSRSCGSESHDDSVVECIGQKPPLSSAAECRPFKTAYVRIASFLFS
mmetsp:Transcript_10224/g.22732  ORF Transcript_10224/g.22732 Transcript_10224/m.22732 type:complete len:153 (-) Transcript_10224:348-806(-)